MATSITDTSLSQVNVPGYGILQDTIDQLRNIAIFRNVPYAKAICPLNTSNYPLVKLSPEEVYTIPRKPHPFGLDHDETNSLNLNIFVPLEALEKQVSVPVMIWWVRENIQTFGGDNLNVTVFGESTGSILIHFSILTPAHYGPFDYAFMRSGTVSTIPAGIVRVDEQPLFDDLLSKLDIPLNLSPAEKMRQLRAVPMNKLTLPSAYDPDLKSLMNGTNKDEDSAFIGLLGSQINLVTWPRIVEHIFPVPELRPLFEKIYGLPQSELQVYKIASQVVSDSMFLYPTEIVSNIFVELAKQWEGEFKFPRHHFDAIFGYMDTIVPCFGAMHASESALSLVPPMADKYMTPRELSLSKEMQELRLLFANQ
ncbi:Carboxylesterase 5A [Podila epicladia]|nr:Carboxylesterase 5A [Podila epicladia]